MAELEKVLKDVVLGSVGAVAAVVEKGGEIARTLVEKGQATVEQNQETVDSIRRKVRSMCEAVSGEGCRTEEDEAVSFEQTERGFILRCPMQTVSPDKAEAMRALLAQAEEPAAEEAAEDAPLLVRLDTAVPGVNVQLDLRLLSGAAREALRALLPDDETENNG